jgi:hypothetical protein
MPADFTSCHAYAFSAFFTPSAPSRRSAADAEPPIATQRHFTMRFHSVIFSTYSSLALAWENALSAPRPFQRRARFMPAYVSDELPQFSAPADTTFSARFSAFHAILLRFLQKEIRLRSTAAFRPSPIAPPFDGSAVPASLIGS